MDKLKMAEHNLLSKDRPFWMDTLIKRIVFCCTASAKVEAKSAEAVMPDEADISMVVVPSQELAEPLDLLHDVNTILAAAGFCVCPIPGLQGLYRLQIYVICVLTLVSIV